MSPVSVPVAHVAQASLGALVLFALVALAAAVATWRKPSLALAALIVAGPFDFSQAIGPTTITLAKAVLIGALLGLALRRAPLRPLLALEVRALVLGALAIVAATALSALPATYIDATARETLKAIQYFFTFACACLAYASDPDESLVWNALGVVTLLVCMLALVQEVTTAPSGIVLLGRTIPRIAGPLEGPNQLAAWCDLVVPMLAARALFGSRAPLVAVVAVVAATTDALTLSRSGYIGLAAGLAVLGYVAYRAGFANRIAIAIACALAPLLALVVLFSAGGLQAALGTFFAWAAPSSGESRLDDGLAPRAQLWRAALRMWASDPGLGVGAGNYELLTPTVGLIGVRTHANSLYLQTLAEGGIPLFAATVWTIVAALVLLLRSTRVPLRVGIAAATVALAVHQCFDYLTFYPKVGGLWWTLLGVGAGIATTKPSVNSTAVP